MTARHSVRFLKRTERSQRVAQREIVGTGKNVEFLSILNGIQSMQWGEITYRKSVAQSGKILKEEHWAKHLEFSGEGATKESSEDDIIKATR